MNKFLLLISLFLSTYTTWGQEYSFEAITSKDGLSQNDVLDIYQDSYGFIWVATIDGLNRYDGYNFKIYQVLLNNNNSISSNLVKCITEDQNKNLWIGTLEKGICKFNLVTEEFTAIQNTANNPSVLTENKSYGIYCDNRNRIWQCTPFGVNCITQLPDGTLNITKINHNPSDSLSLSDDITYTVFEDKRGFIWIGNADALDLMVDSDKGIVQNKFEHYATDTIYLAITDILETDKGIVFGHYQGVELLSFKDGDYSKPEYTSIVYMPVEEIDMDKDGNIWAGSHNGLYLIEHNEQNNPPYHVSQHFIPGDNEKSLNNQFVRCLETDNNGTLWIGTNGGGISKCNKSQIKFRHYKQTKTQGSISNNKVWGIYEDNKHNIWMGTEGGGLNLLPNYNKKKYANGFTSYDVNFRGGQNFIFQIINISNTEEPILWAGAGFHSLLVEVKEVNNTWKIKPVANPSSRHFMCICKDSNGSIWGGTYEGGLLKYASISTYGRWINYNTQNSFLPSNIIRSITEDSKGRLWIGTSKGLAALTPEQKNREAPEFIIFNNDPSDSKSISHSYVVPIVETSTKDIWLGTFGGGLNKYIEGTDFLNGSFERVTSQNGLPNNMVKQIIEDDIGFLWVSTNKGLTRLNPRDNSIRNFDIFDGLQDMAFTDMSGCKLHDGEILFGGVNGFNAFYPSDISEDTTQPKLVFTDIELFNTTIHVGEEINKRVLLSKSLNELKEITLKHNENDFTIHFTGLHYSAPHKNLYKYILEGYDKDWYLVESDRRFSKYTNLKPGTYIFKFTASNSDGKWCDEFRQLSVNIRPPFWITWWFRIFVLIVISTFVLLIFYLRMQQMRKRNMELETEVSARTREIQEKNRVLKEQAEELNETNTILEERQQKIEEQAEELRAQRDELYDTNTLLEERTQEIELQRDKLAEVNSVKDRLFSIVAHDLKNPFTTLVGFLDVLDLKYDKYDDQKRKTMLKYALGSVKNIQTLLINLLNWARSQSGSIKFKPEEMYIDDVIATNISLVEDQAINKKIKIAYKPALNPIKLRADKNLISTVLRNLLTNAIKFTNPDGTIEIDCHTEQQNMILSVKDSGVGISKENMEKLFRTDVHFTTYGTDNEQGTGLGLVTCKDFITMHKGNIEIESEVGIGTKFTIIIPIANEKDNNIEN